ncbi:MAG: MipA/OmpV family protein [Nitrospinae bacterium]|nr:MipA/OmpV family protein [Nitrospinota bacterium]
MRRLALAWVTVVALALPCRAEEAPRPLWEYGLAGGYLSWPEYLGSDVHLRAGLALPYFTYRGERFRAGRDGARGVLISRDRFSLDVGFGIDLPVSAREGSAREGMPSLPITGELGPRAQVALYHGLKTTVTLRAPFRWAFDTDGHNVGWIADPDLLIGGEAFYDGLSAYVDFGAKIASASYGATYYGVAPAYATADRRVYEAREGLHALYATLGMRIAFDEDWTAGFYGKYSDMSAGVVADSPLVRRPTDTAFGVWFTWRIGRSEADEEREGVIDIIETDGR